MEPVKQKNNRKWIWMAVLLAGMLAALFFVMHNEAFYTTTIAQVMEVKEQGNGTATGQHGEKERYITQTLSLRILNGTQKGARYQVENQYGVSQVRTEKYKKGDRLFVSFYTDHEVKKVSIQGLKRDVYAVGVFFVFLFLLVLLAGRRGVRTMVSMIGNVVIFGLFLMGYQRGVNLIVLATILMLCFSLITLFLLDGISSKMVAAAVSTLTTVVLVFGIYRLVLLLPGEIPYYMIEYLVYPTTTLRNLFMISILVGGLGAAMDVSVTICSAVYELIQVNADITIKDLVGSVRNMGQDLMGTMQSVLLFTYLSGALPMMFLMLRSGYYLNTLLQYDFSFEIVRFLTGSIGIVLSVPVAGFVSIFFFYWKGYGQKKKGGDS